LENKLNLLDSAAAIYDTLTKKFPGSVYSAEILPELNLYNQEKIKMENAYNDSIKVYAAKGDSAKFKRLSLQEFEDAQNLALINKAATISASAIASESKNKRVQTPTLPNTGNNLQPNAAANPDTLIRVFNRGILGRSK